MLSVAPTVNKALKLKRQRKQKEREEAERREMRMLDAYIKTVPKCCKTKGCYPLEGEVCHKNLEKENAK